MSTFKTRKNETKLLHYDARGREDYHTWAAGAAPSINRVWDAANRLTSIANVWSTIEYGYDEGGQAKWERSNVVGSNAPAQVNYFRFPSGQVSQISYPGGATVVNRFYTARAQLKGVGWGSGSTSYAYHPDGKVDYQAFSGPGGVWTKYEYNGRGMIDWVKHRVGDDETGHDLARRDYYRDERDRILAWKRGNDQFYNLMEDGRGNRYRYDDEGQLDRASYWAVLDSEWNASDARRSDIFTYDELGNRMGSNYLASRGTLDFTRDNNGLNQYSGWWPYSVVRYDDDVGGIWGSPGAANGVLMEEGYFTAGFNALNQPTGIWSKAYVGTSNWMYFGYDPLGRCVKRWVAPYGAASTNATYYYYDGWNLIQEGSSASVDRVYVHGGRVDEIVASAVGGEWSHHHYDAQGNCIMLTDTNGLIREQYDYDAFGFPYFYDRWGNYMWGLQGRNRFLFTGREWIKDLRLYDYRARLYQPELGRFLQPDPMQFAAGDYNLYRYCHNDPVNKSDPSGLETLTRPEIDDQVGDRISGLAQAIGASRAWQNFISDTQEMLSNPASLVGPGNIGMAAAGRSGIGRALVERMLQAGNAADRGGLSFAGRALEKHGSRPGSVFPKATGNVEAKNAQGEQVLRGILGSKDQTTIANKIGGKDVIDNTTGRGARFDDEGKMKGFLEPPRK
jgi:RHS repeat-associated protein